MTPATAIRMRAALRSPQALDVTVTAIAFALTLALLAGAHGASRRLDALGVLLAAVACLPLLAHRRSALGVFALTTAASALLAGLGYGLGPPFGPTVALFFLAAEERTTRDARVTAALVLSLFAAHVGAATIGEGGFSTDAVLFGTLVWGAAWVFGDRARERRRRLAELEERAARGERERERERRLAALDDLAERQRAMGLGVDVRVEGSRRPLAPALDQAAYRILQESLTNAARHGIGPAEVTVAYGERALTVSVSNPVAPAANGASAEGRHGLLGMRERAALVGGELRAGREDGRFRVKARLPYAAAGGDA